MRSLSSSHKKLAFIGSTFNESFLFSSKFPYTQSQITKTINNYFTTSDTFYRFHPASFKERLLITSALNLLFHGIYIDTSLTFDPSSYDYVCSISSSFIYKSIFAKIPSFVCLPGFLVEAGIPKVDMTNFTDSLSTFFSSSNTISSSHLTDFINRYSFPGNLYYLDNTSINNCAYTFCSICASF